MKKLLKIDNFKELNDNISATFRPWKNNRIIDFALLRDSDNLLQTTSIKVLSPSIGTGFETVFFTDHNALIVDLDLSSRVNLLDSKN